MLAAPLSYPLLRVGSYNYRAAANLSRSTTYAIGSPVIRAKTWTEKPVQAKAEENSMNDTIFTLVATSMETGCLSLPIVLKYAGLIPGIIIIVIAAYLSYLSMNNISFAAERRNLFDYSKLVKDLLGTNTSIFLDLILVLYLFISVAGYTLICNESILNALLYFDINLSDYTFLIMLCYSLFIVYPMSLLQKVTELKVFSYISIGSILYICINIILDFPKYIEENDMTDLKLYNFDLNFFSACTFALFSFTCHMSIASVFSDMDNPSKRRMKTVNLRVCAYQLVIYLILAVVGYISLLENTPLFIIQRIYPKNYSNSLRNVIARVLVCTVILVTMPLFTILCRQSIQSIIFSQKKRNFSAGWKALVNLIIIVCSLVVSKFFPEVLVVFSFLGAFCAVFSYLLPALLEVVSNKYKWSYIGNILLVFIGITLTIIAFVSAFLSLVISNT